MLNKTLTDAVAKVMANPAPSHFLISAHFLSAAQGSTWSWYPFSIEELVYDRDYLANFTDNIDLTMTISTDDYATLQDQGQDLLCVLTLTYTEPSGKVLYTPGPIQTQYKVAISDARDVRMAVPDAQARKEPNHSITVRLTEDSVYKVRHNRINDIYQNTTVASAIVTITHALGIERLHLVPPDNVHQYDHIAIPSYQGLASIYGYLQDECGVYWKGANYYLTGGVLYVYPAFETAPVYDKTAIFYQIAKGDYAGAAVFHRVENKNVSIVLNEIVESYDQSIVSAENDGTGFIFTPASRLTDGFTAIDSKTGAEYTSQPALSVSLTDARTAVSGQNNIHHIKATDNPFPAMSRIAAGQCSIAQVRWEAADPFQLDPGHAVVFYYDRNEIMIKKTGILQHAKFHIRKLRKMGAQDVYSTVGILTLRLSPNETKVL